MALDIEERHLLRLGHGEEALETEKDFSRLDRKCLVLETMQTQALQSIKVMDQQKVQKCSDGYIQILTNHFLVLIIFRYGRVNFVLASRLELLKEVQRLQVSTPRCFFDSCASSLSFLTN